MKKLALITCTCLLAFGISACGGGGSPVQYHSITFDSKGGSDVPGQTVAHGEKIIKPDDPVKNGYSFINWLYRNEAWSFSGHVVTEDMTLTADWSINTYNITYILDGGTNSSSNPLVYTVEDEFDFKDPIKNGFAFTGWTKDEEVITDIKKGSIGDLVIKANWSIITYEITYNLDGGTNNPSNPSVYNIESPTIELMQPTKLGYKFLGWTINGTPISLIQKGSTGNIRLEANWSIITYSITYNLDGGSNNPSNPETYTIEDEYNLYRPNREGYTFTNWVLNDEPVTTIKKGTTGDLVINAGWSINHYDVVVVSSDTQKGTVTGSGRYDYNSQVTVTATTQENCLFIGWFSDGSLNRLITQAPSYSFNIPVNNVSLFAYFVSLEESFYEFSLNEDQKSYTLTKYYSNSNPKIIIPSVYNNLPITTIGESAFLNCSSISSLTIPDSVTSIEERAFSNCISLASITIPDSVTTIGNYAFCDCTKLFSVTIGKGVKEIHFETFERDYRVVEVINKSSIDIRIGESIFSHFKYAKQVIPDESLSKLSFELDDYVLYLDEGEVYLVEYLGNETSITIPDSVTTIGNYAFYNCTSLTSTIIPNSVTKIGNYAFSNCSSLTSTIIPDSVTKIGNYAFSNCSSLISIVIPDGVASIGERAFSYCTSLASITIPNSVTYIGQSAFNNCYKLVEVINKSKLNIVAGSSKYGNVALYAKQVIPDESLSKLSFELDDYVLYLDEGEVYLVEYLGNETSITIPDSVTTIGNYAFYNCSSITSIIIPDGVASIKERAFSGCKSLASITIPDSVTSIGQYAFSGCRSLTSITIPDSVTSIQDYAFSYCYKLVEVINKSKLNIVAGSSKYGNVALYAKQVITDESLSKLSYELDDYVLYLDEGEIYLVEYFGNDTSITIPDSVTYIGQYAFYCLTSLTSVVIPNTVTSIGQYAFSGCSSLTSITIPDSVTSIEKDAFYNCSSLTSITIPDSVTSIEKYAFCGCGSLSAVYYCGTQYEWNNISIREYNDSLTNASIFYYSETKPTESGNYWHYVDGVPTAW